MVTKGDRHPFLRAGRDTGSALRRNKDQDRPTGCIEEPEGRADDPEGRDLCKIAKERSLLVHDPRVAAVLLRLHYTGDREGKILYPEGSRIVVAPGAAGQLAAGRKDR